MEELKHALKLLQECLTDLVVEGDKLKLTDNIPEICKYYRQVYEVVDVIDAQLAIAQEIKTEFSKKVMPPLFEAKEVSSISSAGRQFILNPEIRVSIPQEKLTKGLGWLRDNGYGMLVKEGVNAQTLTAAVREYIRDKGQMPPEDTMNIHMGYYISMRKK